MWWRSGGAVLSMGLLAAIVTVAASTLVGSDGLSRLLVLRGERSQRPVAAEGPDEWEQP